MRTQTSLKKFEGIPLFQELTEDELRYVAKDLVEREYKSRDVIYKESEMPGLLYIVQEGTVEITKKAPTGHRQVIATNQPGQFFGELSFFGKRRHSARAQAKSDLRLVLLHRFAYDELEKEHPPVVHKLLRAIILVMSTNLDNMNDMFLQLIHYTFYGGKTAMVEMPGENV